ncbi:hypothetical protein A2U01_0028267, partial [Trifolium medium]|nr:hypothetical protein [Trifolium medium]
MSNSPKSSSIAIEQNPSPSKDVLSYTITHAVPITTVLPQSSKKKKVKASTVKKEKASKTVDAVVPETPEDVPIPENEKSPDRLVTDNEENWSDDHTVVNSQSDESMKTVSGNHDDGV